ncbi:hypothetical protein FRB90_002668 [Tulasnella sp. 427]|nr:hypothetical protein FRB90_002668 [Tulasnella sp. 427]
MVKHFNDPAYSVVSSSSDRSSSPTPTLQSLTDSMFDGLFDTKHGRRVNSTNATYSLAADEPEIMRMDEEHTLYKYLFQGLFGDELYVGPKDIVNDILKPDPYEEKRILDLGTGTAAWAIDMAKRWPNADVVGIDLAPLQPDAESLPENCRLEMDDLNLSLEHYYNSTDLIHIRLLASGLRDYPGFLDQCARTLKPGGLIYFCETDFRAYHAPNTKSVYLKGRKLNGDDPSQKSKYFSPTAMMIQAIMSALHQKMANIDAAANLRRWITEHPQLEELEYRDLFLPLMQLFPHDKDNLEAAFSNEIARLVGKDFNLYVDSFLPCLLDFRSQEEIDRMKAAAIAEIKNPKRQVLVRVVVMTARKKM